MLEVVYAIVVAIILIKKVNFFYEKIYLEF